VNIKEKILYEDGDIIVLVKKAGISSQAERGSSEDMVSILKNYLFEKGEKNPYIAVVHRLDKMTGGVMVYAKNKKSADNLTKQIMDGKIKKNYYAITTNMPIEKEGKLIDFLARDGKTNTSFIAKEGDPEAKRAELNYKWLESKEYDAGIEKLNLHLFEVELITGRHHQIRVQFSNINSPLFGDAKYNKDFSDIMKGKKLGLFACSLKFLHPINSKEMEFAYKPKDGIFALFN